MPGIKEVAALAAVSVGTVSNVLNRPEQVAPRDPGAGPASHGGARLRAQRVGPAAACRPEQCPGLRDARRHQPVLHRRGPRGRGGCGAGRPVGVPLQQRQPAGTRAQLPPPPPAAARAGHPHHPPRPRAPVAVGGGRRRHPSSPRRPHARRGVVLLGVRRRRPRRRARGEPSPRDRPRADRVRRRARLARPGAGAGAGGPPGGGVGRPCPGPPHRSRLVGLDRGAGARGRTADRRPARQEPPHGAFCAATTWWRSACCSSA